MEQIRLYHGSIGPVEKPVFGYGNIRNDCGEGFYCTDGLLEPAPVKPF